MELRDRENFRTFERLLPPRTRTSFMGLPPTCTSSQRMAQLKSTRKKIKGRLTPKGQPGRPIKDT